MRAASALFVALCLIGAAATLASCRKPGTSRVRVVASDGSVQDEQLSLADTEGAKEGRGFVALERLGRGELVTVVGSGGATQQLPASSFPGTNRLFLRRDGKLQLVRYKGPGEAPPAGSKIEANEGRKHRDRWETLIEDVVEIRFGGR